RGVDQYLELRKASAVAPAGTPALAATGASTTSSVAAGAAAAAPAAPALAGAERRTAEKELSSIDRRLEKLAAEIARLHERLAVHDQSDYVGLGTLGDELRALEASVAELETRWLEVSESLEG
ncbi:MAG TPA: ABC transporter C-terminal domain-containing protein, partial [Agromyces sp.]|nr:ABC transporter C-terminal domain-containing protein [Agromyces sp.]